MREKVFPSDVLDLAQAIANFENDEVVAGFCLKKMDWKILSIGDSDCFFPSPQLFVGPLARCEYCEPIQ